MTRRSATICVILLGGHCITGWRATQKVIALPSCEAEFYAAGKGGAGGLRCMMGLLEDLGMAGSVRHVTIRTDSTATLGTGRIMGLRKRHACSTQSVVYATQHIYIIHAQTATCTGTANPADALTQFSAACAAHMHMAACSAEAGNAMHAIAPSACVYAARRACLYTMFTSQHIVTAAIACP